MDISYLSDIIKVVSAVIGGGLGISAVLVNYRNASGKINLWGIIVILGLIVSCACGSMATILDSRADELNRNKQERKNEIILNDIDRSINPLKSIKLFYNFSVPPGNQYFSDYEKTVFSALDIKYNDMARVAEKHGYILPGVEAVGFSVDTRGRERIVSFDMKYDSPLRPRGKYQYIEDALGRMGMNIYLYKKPIDPIKFQPMLMISQNLADFDAHSLPSAHANDINIDYDDRSLNVSRSIVFAPETWQSNDTISSVLDVAGSQIFLYPSTGDIYACRDKATTAANSLNLDTVNLDFGDGRNLWIRGDKLRRTILANGCAVYSYIFPKLVSDFRALWRAGLR